MKESATHSAYDMFLAVCHREPARIGTNQDQHEKSLADGQATPVRKAFCFAERRSLLKLRAMFHLIGDLRIIGHHNNRTLTILIALGLLQQPQHHGGVVTV